MCSEVDVILRTNHVIKNFTVSKNRILTACNDINLNVYKGKTLGIVGESGCGKSTFVRMLTQMDNPTSGEILYHGKNIVEFSKKEKWLNRQNIQMVFQDSLASFDPKMKILDIVTEPLLNYKKINRNEKEDKAIESLEMVGLSKDFIYRYPHNMSGGQRQRVSIARALALEPEILVCDEATSALDVSIQDNIIKLLVELQNKKGVSIVFICHDLALISSFAHEIAVMYLGNVVEILPGEKVAHDSHHPYTRTLLQAQFSVNIDEMKEIEKIEGENPSPLEISKGCPFQIRCEHCRDKCKKEKPKLQKINRNHWVSCHYLKNII